MCESVFETECKTNYHEHEVEEDEPDCRIMMVKIKDFFQRLKLTSDKKTTKVHFI